MWVRHGAYNALFFNAFISRIKREFGWSGRDHEAQSLRARRGLLSVSLPLLRASLWVQAVLCNFVIGWDIGWGFPGLLHVPHLININRAFFLKQPYRATFLVYFVGILSMFMSLFSLLTLRTFSS